MNIYLNPSPNSRPKTRAFVAKMKGVEMPKVIKSIVPKMPYTSHQINEEIANDNIQSS